MDQLRAWGSVQNGGSERPLYSRLPRAGYQDNTTADALTRWVDGKYIETKQRLETFYRELSPDTCKAESLDYLAALVALSDNYYDPRWSESVKRQMIANVAYLMKRRGTYEAIKKVLEIHGLDYRLWTQNALTMPFQMPQSFGSDSLRYYLRMPLKYARLGSEFKEAQRTLLNYGSAFARSAVCYEYFYMGYSLLGDPMFALPVDKLPGTLPAVVLPLFSLAAANSEDPNTTFSFQLPAKPSDSTALPYRVSPVTVNGGTLSVSGRTVTFRPAVGFRGWDTATYWLEGDRRPSALLSLQVLPLVVSDLFATGGFEVGRRVPDYSAFGDVLTGGFSVGWAKGANPWISASNQFSLLLIRGRSTNYRLVVDAATMDNSVPIRLIIGGNDPVNPSSRVFLDIYRNSFTAYAVDGSVVTPYVTVNGRNHSAGYGAGGAGVRERVVVDVREEAVRVRLTGGAINFTIPGLSNRPFFHGVQAAGTVNYRVHQFSYLG